MIDHRLTYERVRRRQEHILARNAGDAPQVCGQVALLLKAHQQPPTLPDPRTGVGQRMLCTRLGPERGNEGPNPGNG